MNTSTKRQKKQDADTHIRLKDRLRGHPFVVPVVTFLVLFFITVVGFIGFGGSTIGASDSRLVYLSFDGKRQAIPTRAGTIAEMLKKLNIEVSENDVVEPALDTPIIDDNLSVNIYRARPVTVIDGNITKVTLSAESAPKQIATQAGVTVYPEDKITKTVTAEAVDRGFIGEVVRVERSTPLVINLYGTDVPTRTLSKTVADVLKEKNIETKEGDTITPAPDTQLSASTKIFITRLGKQVISAEEEITPPQQNTNDPSLPSGSIVVKQPGKPGKKVVTYEIELKNDKEIGRKVLYEVIVEQPEPRVVVKGTKLAVPEDILSWLKASSIPSQDYEYVDYIMRKESNWRPAAVNSRGCIGIGQSCPYNGRPPGVSVSCPNWQIDAVCQLEFFNNYARSRYGGWSGAYNFWTANRWW